MESMMMTEFLESQFTLIHYGLVFAAPVVLGATINFGCGKKRKPTYPAPPAKRDRRPAADISKRKVTPYPSKSKRSTLSKSERSKSKSIKEERRKRSSSKKDPRAKSKRSYKVSLINSVFGLCNPIFRPSKNRINQKSQRRTKTRSHQKLRNPSVKLNNTRVDLPLYLLELLDLLPNLVIVFRVQLLMRLASLFWLKNMRPCKLPILLLLI